MTFFKLILKNNKGNILAQCQFCKKERKFARKEVDAWGQV